MTAKTLIEASFLSGLPEPQDAMPSPAQRVATVNTYKMALAASKRISDAYLIKTYDYDDTAKQYHEGVAADVDCELFERYGVDLGSISMSAAVKLMRGSLCYDKYNAAAYAMDVTALTALIDKLTLKQIRTFAKDEMNAVQKERRDLLPELTHRLGENELPDPTDKMKADIEQFGSVPQLVYSAAYEGSTAQARARAGKPVQIGDKVKLRGERRPVTVTYFAPPSKPSSEGKVCVQYAQRSSGWSSPADERPWTREFFVSVIGAEWVGRTDRGYELFI